MFLGKSLKKSFPFHLLLLYMFGIGMWLEHVRIQQVTVLERNQQLSTENHAAVELSSVSYNVVTPPVLINDNRGQDDDAENKKQGSTEEVLIQPQNTTEFITSRLGVMEVQHGIIEEMKKVDISIVISHCEMPLNWIPGYIGKDYSIKDITIYSKCGNEVAGIELLEKFIPTVNVIELPNVGRCNHTYAYYIKEQYKYVVENEETNGNDIVMFLKDNGRGKGRWNSIDTLLSHASKSGFACVTKPLFHPSLYDKYYDTSVVTMQHMREYLLENLALEDYTRLERDTNEAFFSDKYTSFKTWKEDMKFVIPASETMPVCYKGLFVAQKRQFLNQPEEAWENMVESLSRTDNLMEGHYAERMWASILSDVDEESAKAVDEVLTPHIAFVATRGEFNPLKGQVYMNMNVPSTNQNVVS